MALVIFLLKCTRTHMIEKATDSTSSQMSESTVNTNVPNLSDAKVSDREELHKSYVSKSIPQSYESNMVVHSSETLSGINI